MVKYCGYLVGDEWLIQRVVDLGHPRPVTGDDRIDMILMGAEHVRMSTNVYRYTKFRRVKTLRGPSFGASLLPRTILSSKGYQPAHRRRKDTRR
jgi:hypothetical protein